MSLEESQQLLHAYAVIECNPTGDEYNRAWDEIERLKNLIEEQKGV